MTDLVGRRGNALITGASSGIGRALALRLAALGRRITLVSRDRSALELLAGEIERAGGSALAFPADLTVASERVRLTAAIESERFELVASAAGYGSSGPFLAASTQQDLEMIDVNCGAVVEITRAAASRMDRGGTIVLFSSLVAWQGVPMSATYAATKAFIQSLGEALSVELAAQGIKVLTCAPGPVHSGFAARARMELGGADQADDVARGIVRSLHRSGTIVPGGVGKLLTFALSGLPRFVRVRIMGRIMSGMSRAR